MNKKGFLISRIEQDMIFMYCPQICEEMLCAFIWDFSSHEEGAFMMFNFSKQSIDIIIVDIFAYEKRKFVILSN